MIIGHTFYDDCLVKVEDTFDALGSHVGGDLKHSDARVHIRHFEVVAAVSRNRLDIWLLNLRLRIYRVLMDALLRHLVLVDF